jgi:integrating conjugative element protein (TIGR03765 family)
MMMTLTMRMKVMRCGISWLTLVAMIAAAALSLNSAFALNAQHQLVVIADHSGSFSGNTVSAAAFYHFPKLTDIQLPDVDEAKAIAVNQQPKTMTPANTFNQYMTAGKVVSHQQASHLTQPIFIMGNDALSIKWYQANAERLQKIKAIGFAINMSDGEIKALKQQLGVYLIQSHTAYLGKAIGVEHYPVLITSKGVYQ